MWPHTGRRSALGAYVTDLQHRLKVATRRREPMAERPTALEITAAQGVIARFAGFVRLAAPYMFGQLLLLSRPWPAESGGEGHAAGKGLGRRGGSGARHPGRQPGSS
jgi:hypothetical protein